MKAFENLRHYRTYRRIVVSYLIIVAVTTSVITVSLFSLFSMSAKRELRNVADTMLTQLNSVSTLFFDQVHSAANQLLGDPKIIQAMYTREKDYLLDFETVSKLNALQGIHPFILYTSIYNPHIGTVLNNKWIGEGIDDDVRDFILSTKDYSPYKIYPRTLSLPTVDRARYRLLSYVVVPASSRHWARRGALILNLDESYLHSLLDGMIGEQRDAVTVLDAEGAVLSYASGDARSRVQPLPYLESILQGADRAGHFTHRTDGETFLVTYQRSNGPGWIFVSEKSYSAALGYVTMLRNVILAISLGLLVLGILLSFRVTSLVYLPVRSIVRRIQTEGAKIGSANDVVTNELQLLSDAFSETMRRIDTLEGFRIRSTSMLRDSYLRFFLRGGTLELSGATQGLRDMKDVFSAPFCRVVAVLPEHESDHETRKRLSRMLSETARQLQAVSRDGCEWFVVHMEESLFLVILQADEESGPESLSTVIETLSPELEDEIGSPLCFGIGDLHPAPEGLHASFDSAMEYLRYRFFGKRILSRPGLGEQLEHEGEYPVELEEAIFDAVRLNDTGLADLAVKRFADAVRPLTYRQAILFMNQLVFSIYKEFSSSLDHTWKEDENAFKLIHEFPLQKNLTGMTDSLYSIAAAVAATLERNRKGKNSEVIRGLMEYVRAEYADPNLSLDLLAEKVGFSTGYLRKQFKLVANQSFGDFLNTVRLEKARELLLGTQMTASEIRACTGFGNNSYFFTLFKKHFGSTPNGIRTRNLAKQD